MTYSPVPNDDIQELRAFLSEADLTGAGLDSTAVRVWVERDPNGRIVGSTGYEASTDGADVVIRSVAVSSSVPTCPTASSCRRQLKGLRGQRGRVRRYVRQVGRASLFDAAIGLRGDRAVTNAFREGTVPRRRHRRSHPRGGRVVRRGRVILASAMLTIW